MFHDIIGWRLQFFASAEQLKSEKHAMSKKRYGAADVMLWKKEIQNTTSARITFRLSGDSELWISGRSKRCLSLLLIAKRLTVAAIVSASTSVSSSSKDATCWFDIFGKQHGRLLDISNMTAVPDLILNDPTSGGPPLGIQGDYRRITLRIQDRKHRQKLAELVEELTHAIAQNPRASINTRPPVIRPRSVLPTPMAQ